jgi:glycosyltransferase involved in cell wall biosynthesis
MDEFLKMIEDCKKIALLVPNFAAYSGDARVVELQARDLRDLKKEVNIITFHQEIDLNLPVIEIGMPKSLFWQRIYRLIFPVDLIKINHIVKDLKEYDLIISHLYPMNWLAHLAKKRYDIKYIYWYHGVPEPALYPKLYERIYLKLFIYLTGLTAKNADRIFSVSQYARCELHDYTNLNSGVVYNKVNLSRFSNDIDGSPIRSKYSIDNSPVILNVGRVCPQKGAHLLIQAFDIVRKEIPDAKLIIVGKHSYAYYTDRIKNMCDESVVFADYVSDSDLPLYYASCDVYATCSLWETFNIPIAEAQACGKSVVAFDIGPHSEIVNSNGVLVERENIEKFAEACVMKIKQVRGDIYG